jgi:hypothetical protein
MRRGLRSPADCLGRVDLMQADAARRDREEQLGILTLAGALRHPP